MNPAGDTIATASADRTIKLWRAERSQFGDRLDQGLQAGQSARENPQWPE
jgi:hypothetical protein